MLRNPFSPDETNPYRKFADTELRGHHNTVARCVEHPEEYANGTRLAESRARLDEITEEMERRGDVDEAVKLWERLCAIPFVRGETQGFYTHSTTHLNPAGEGIGHVSHHRMPNREELEALVLSDGEETDYPVHEVETRPFILEHVSTNPWSGDDRLYPITLTLISCGDYHGSDLDAANNRALKGTPGVEFEEPNSGGMSSVFNRTTTVVGAMTAFANLQGDVTVPASEARATALEWLEYLVTRLEGLQEYALLDEEEHGKLVEELAEEAWGNHLEGETFDALKALAPDDSEEERADSQQAYEESDAQVHRAYFEHENEWTIEGMGAVNRRHDEAVKHVARTVFGWDV